MLTPCNRQVSKAELSGHVSKCRECQDFVIQTVEPLLYTVGGFLRRKATIGDVRQAMKEANNILDYERRRQNGTQGDANERR